MGFTTHARRIVATMAGCGLVAAASAEAPAPRPRQQYGTGALGEMLKSSFEGTFSDREKAVAASIWIETPSILGKQPAECSDPLNFAFSTETANGRTITVCGRNVRAVANYGAMIVDLARLSPQGAKPEYAFDYARIQGTHLPRDIDKVKATVPCALFEYVALRSLGEGDADTQCAAGTVPSPIVEEYEKAHPELGRGQSQEEQDSGLETVKAMREFFMRQVLFAAVLHEIGHFVRDKPAKTLCDAITNETMADDFVYEREVAVHRSDANLLLVARMLTAFYALANIQGRDLAGARKIQMLRLQRLADVVLAMKPEDSASPFSLAGLDVFKKSTAAQREEARQQLATLKPCSEVLDFTMVKSTSKH